MDAKVSRCRTGCLDEEMLHQREAHHTLHLQDEAS